MKFNWDNIVFQMLGKLVDCVWVSILWVICCIPVFTIGASTTALYYTVHKSIRGDRGYTTRTFFGAFRDNFKAATLPVQKCMQHSYDRLKVDGPYCFLHVRIWSAVLP